MLDIKIENFESEENGEEFPEFSSLDNIEIVNHQNRLRAAFKCSMETPILDVFKKLVDKSYFVSGVNANDDGFNLSDVIASQGINSDEKVYIDWYRFDDIDCIDLLLLSKYFDDIWYPEADDIYIYDNNFSWFALVTHYGAISITFP